MYYSTHMRQGFDALLEIVSLGLSPLIDWEKKLPRIDFESFGKAEEDLDSEVDGLSLDTSDMGSVDISLKAELLLGEALL